MHRPFLKASAIVLSLAIAGLAFGQDSQPARATDHPANAAELPVVQAKTTARVSGPRLELSTSEWNFGRKWYGDPAATQVELTNVGDAPLTIIKVKSSCGCTTGQLKKKVLAPGESDTLTITYNTRKGTRDVTQQITIESTDPQQRTVIFKVTGEVLHVFDAKPYPRIPLGLLKPDTAKTSSIELTNNLEEKVFPKLKPIDPDSPFDIKLEEIEPGMKYKLSASTKPPLRPGTSQVTVELETGVERLPKMTIPVSAIALDRISVRPDRIWMYETQTMPSTRMILLNFPADQDLKITKLESDHSSVTVINPPILRPPMETSEFAAYQIRLKLPPFKELPDLGVMIEVETDDSDPRFQKFSIPVQKRAVSKPATPVERAEPSDS